MSDSDLLAPKEAAARLGVNVKTLRRWAEAGELTAVRTLGGHHRYLTDEIEALRTEAVS
jgi:excisionase family DNA binding protein